MYANFNAKNAKNIFSSRTLKIDYRQKRMDLNDQFAKLLSEGNSIRGISRIMGLTYKNTYNKFLWFQKLVDSEKENLIFTTRKLQIDELESIHHTKCKPLRVAIFLMFEKSTFALDRTLQS